MRIYLDAPDFYQSYFIFGMEITPGEVCHIWSKWLHLIKDVHNDLISDFALFHIHETIFNARTSKFDTNIEVSVTLDLNSRFW